MNANKVKREPIVIELDKVRHLRFTLGGLADLEDKYGDVDKPFKLAEEGKMRPIIDILYAGLTHEDPSLTVEEVGNIIDIADIQYISECLGRAMEHDHPDQPVVVEGK